MIELQIAIEQIRLLSGYDAICVSRIVCNGVDMDYSEYGEENLPPSNNNTWRYSMMSGVKSDNYDWTFLKGGNTIGGAMVGDIAYVTINSIEEWRRKQIDNFIDKLDNKYIKPALSVIDRISNSEA